MIQDKYVDGILKVNSWKNENRKNRAYAVVTVDRKEDGRVVCDYHTGGSDALMQRGLTFMAEHSQKVEEMVREAYRKTIERDLFRKEI